MLANSLVRQDTVLYRDNKYHRKLQPFRGVQRHQCDLIGVAVEVVRLIDGPRALQVFLQLAAAWILLVELPRVSQQLLNVSEAILILLIIALGERYTIA